MKRFGNKSTVTSRQFNNERELKANGTVDSVVSYQFLCTLVYYIKFLKQAAIFLILQPAHCNIFNIAACTLQYF